MYTKQQRHITSANIRKAPVPQRYDAMQELQQWHARALLSHLNTTIERRQSVAH